jgi:hypothetical protein
MSNERIPVEQVLTGMTLHPLEPGWTPVEAFVLIKSLDETGTPSWSYRTSAKPNREELLGVLTVQAEVLRRELASEFGDEE